MCGEPRESTGSSWPSPVEAVRQTVGAVSGVQAVKLVGSGAAGERTPLSDWDFELDIEDEGVLEAVERALQRLPVLALFWDPLSARANLIVILDGPIKIDVIVPGIGNPHPVSRWTATADTLPQIDAHFWDWTLWLGAKHLRGKAPLVRTELAKMWDALLEPMAATRPPRNIGDAIGMYVDARSERERELEIRVNRRLEQQVRGVLADQGLLARNCRDRGASETKL
jgi:hypothetical protein